MMMETVPNGSGLRGTKPWTEGQMWPLRLFNLTKVEKILLIIIWVIYKKLYSVYVFIVFYE